MSDEKTPKREVTLTQLPTIFPERGYVTADELAFGLGVHVSTLKMRIKKNRIPFKKMGDKWIVDLAEFWNKLDTVTPNPDAASD